MTTPGVTQVTVDRGLCTGCGNCVRVCPTGVFDLVNRKAVPSRPEKCVMCELCVKNCPVNAITLPGRAPAPAAPAPTPGAGMSPPPPAAPSPVVGIAPPPPPTYTPTPTIVVPSSSATQAPPAAPGISVPQSAPAPPPRPNWIPHVSPPPLERSALQAPVVLSPSAVPAQKELIVLQGVCVGCQLCELACSLTHEGIINPYLSRIRVNQIREEGVIEPTICHHCNPAPCEQSCPTKALFWASNLPGVVMFDEGKCTRCYNCVHACPFGAVQIGPQGQILKCDLCGGNPACVAVCQDRPEFHPPHWPGGKVAALAFVEPQEATRIKRLLNLRGPQR